MHRATDTTDTSELGTSDPGFDMIKSLNRDLKKRSVAMQKGANAPSKPSSQNTKDQRLGLREAKGVRESGRHQQRSKGKVQGDCDCVPFLERIGRLIFYFTFLSHSFIIHLFFLFIDSFFIT